MIKAELALIAEVGDASQIRWSQLGRLPIYRFVVETNKEIIERWAKIVTATTPVANVENTLKLALDLSLFPERFGI
jgi:hypothetical protein